MAGFEGYLFAVVYTKDGQQVINEFPSEYIDYEGWNSTPNAREEVSAERDDYTRTLIRITATGKKSSFTFSTIKGLHLADKKRIQKFFTDAEINPLERKVKIKYWNEEDNTYKTSEFYRANITYPIERIDKVNKDIIYGVITIDCVEY